MTVDLHRTFSLTKDLEDEQDDWSFYTDRNKDRLTWDKIHEHPVSVVLGEAGIGKTIEFKNEVRRIQARGKVAFFIELNLLRSKDDWSLLLNDSDPNYKRWLDSSDDAHFFLDAVDEVRLTDHSAFRRALSIAVAGMRPNLGRVRVVISCRVTDWLLKEVQTAITEILVEPIEASRRLISKAPEPALSRARMEATTTPTHRNEQHSEPFIVSLNPLSIREAKRFAVALGILNEDAFWTAIYDGNYSHLSTRPLDLMWMVNLWNRQHNLGTYSQLLDGNIINRLTETNPNYQTTSIQLSLNQLRRGAEELAAAAEFAGRHYIAIPSTTVPSLNEIVPMEVLPSWTMAEITRLLASAIFDEATYGRVKFHHRSVREYLAACWVDRQLSNGVPLHHVLQLFSDSPFGETVLIPSRQWALSWLATKNVKAREWVTKHFPELLVFDGDPEAWDILSANQAFTEYVQRLIVGVRMNWYNHASEFRRVGRRLPPGRVAALLKENAQTTPVLNRLLQYAKHAHLSDCADVVFSIYRDTEKAEHRTPALEALETIATPTQRIVIKDDLLSGALQGNELIAAALCVVDWPSFTIEQLTGVFSATDQEDSYGSGSIALTIKHDLLPVCTVQSGTLLLSAIMRAMPTLPPSKNIHILIDSNEVPQAWTFDILPDCYERLLEVLPQDLSTYPDICFAAGERLEMLRGRDYFQNGRTTRIRELIKNNKNMRRQLLLRIINTKEFPYATSRVSMDTECIISLTRDDLTALTEQANDPAKTSEERALWFSIVLNIASTWLKGTERRAVIEKLAAGPDETNRRNNIEETLRHLCHSLLERREWEKNRRIQIRKQKEKERANKVNLLANVEYIKNGLHQESIRWLLSYSLRHSDHETWSHVDFGCIEQAFGKEVASALSAGLKASCELIEAPNPTDYKTGNTPRDAITLLAGFNLLFEGRTDIERLKKKDVTQAARVAVWEMNKPPQWFESLVKIHGKAVLDALSPWICDEVMVADHPSHSPRTLTMVLKCTEATRAQLLQPVARLLQEQKITNPGMLKVIALELYQVGLIPATTVAHISKTETTKPLNADNLVQKTHWLNIWLTVDMLAAWAWFKTRMASLDGQADRSAKEIEAFAENCGKLQWVNLDGSPETVNVLLSLFALLTRHQPAASGLNNGMQIDDLDSSVPHTRDAVCNVLARMPGAPAHRALCQILKTETNPKYRKWILERKAQHTELEVEKFAAREPRQLRELGTAFSSEPKTEAQLFQQVMSRLEEIIVTEHAG